MPSKLIIPSMAAVALLGVAGCGSSKKSSSSSPGAPSATAPALTSTTGTTSPTQGAKVPSRTYNVRLRGSLETPPAAAKGSGHAVISLRGKSLQVCWKFRGLTGFDKPVLAAHLHQGPKGVSGPIVVPLGGGYKAAGCAPTSAAEISAIAKHPKGFYVNLHSKKFPGGAVRAQL